MRGNKIPVEDVRSIMMSNGLEETHVDNYLNRCTEDQQVDLDAMMALNKKLAADE